MFGALLRAAPQALLIALLTAVFARVVNPLIDVMTDGPASSNDMLVSGLNSATSNFILVGLAALVLALIARAVLEARLGGV